MKLLTLLLLTLSIYGCKAQTNPGKKAVEMLTEFYKAYCTVSFGIEDAQKVDSLRKEYCTRNLINEAKRYWEDGHDLLTNDFGIRAEDIRTMEIRRVESKTDTYQVNYTTLFDDPGSDAQRKNVTFYVIVLKDGEKYKINGVQ